MCATPSTMGMHMTQSFDQENGTNSYRKALNITCTAGLPNGLPPLYFSIFIFI